MASQQNKDILLLFKQKAAMVDDLIKQICDQKEANEKLCTEKAEQKEKYLAEIEAMKAKILDAEKDLQGARRDLQHKSTELTNLKASLQKKCNEFSAIAKDLEQTAFNLNTAQEENESLKEALEAAKKAQNAKAPLASRSCQTEISGPINKRDSASPAPEKNKKGFISFFNKNLLLTKKPVKNVKFTKMGRLEPSEQPSFPAPSLPGYRSFESTRLGNDYVLPNASEIVVPPRKSIQTAAASLAKATTPKKRKAQSPAKAKTKRAKPSKSSTNYDDSSSAINSSPEKSSAKKIKPSPEKKKKKEKKQPKSSGDNATTEDSSPDVSQAKKSNLVLPTPPPKLVTALSESSTGSGDLSPKILDFGSDDNKKATDPSSLKKGPLPTPIHQKPTVTKTAASTKASKFVDNVKEIIPLGKNHVTQKTITERSAKDIKLTPTMLKAIQARKVQQPSSSQTKPKPRLPVVNPGPAQRKTSMPTLVSGGKRRDSKTEEGNISNSQAKDKPERSQENAQELTQSSAMEMDQDVAPSVTEDLNDDLNLSSDDEDGQENDDNINQTGEVVKEAASVETDSKMDVDDEDHQNDPPKDADKDEPFKVPEKVNSATSVISTGGSEALALKASDVEDEEEEEEEVLDINADKNDLDIAGDPSTLEANTSKKGARNKSKIKDKTNQGIDLGFNLTKHQIDYNESFAEPPFPILPRPKNPKAVTKQKSLDDVFREQTETYLEKCLKTFNKGNSKRQSEMALKSNLKNRREQYEKELTANLITSQLGRLWQMTTENDLNSIVKVLTIPEKALIHKRLIVQYLYLAIRDEKEWQNFYDFNLGPQEQDNRDNQYTGRPLMTLKQSKVFSLLVNLDPAMPNGGIIRETMAFIRYCLFTKNGMYNYRLFQLANLTRVYFCMVRYIGDEEEARVFLFDILFFKSARTHIMINILLDTWPEILQWPGFPMQKTPKNLNLDPLVHAIMWMIYNTGPATSMSDMKVFEARNKLQRLCGFQKPPESGADLVKHFIKLADINYFDNAVKNSATKALMIIARWNEYRWANNHIVSRLLDLLGKIKVIIDPNLL